MTKNMNISMDDIEIINPIIKPDALTKKELETLKLITMGKSHKEIAVILGLTNVHSVQHRTTAVNNKLGTTNLADQTRYAIRHGIISL